MSLRTVYGALAWQVVQLAAGVAALLFLCGVAAWITLHWL